MKSLASILLVLATAGTASAQDEVNRRIGIDAHAYIKVYLLEGSVRVVGWDRDSLAVSGTVATGRLFFGGAGKSAKLGVWDDNLESGSADLEVRVPATSTIWIKSHEADVSVSGVTGGVDAYSVTGDVRVAGTLRHLYAESMGGAIEITASAPSVRAKTAGGWITFRGSGDDLTLSTVAGTIDAAARRNPLRARIETVTGDIRFAGGVQPGGALAFQTHSGAVDIQLPGDLGAEVAVATIEGEIANGLRVAAGGERDLRGRELSFLTGEGGAQVTVRTFSGDVTLSASEIAIER
ncbi:MAG TPA: DUF4097 family beta strand repeat-containing protein [Gemmatimonadota bacterium]|nr:DUF4097 family beta strand repeat-containing protein [Gemmatimonadota bacterium]